ncbi:hypothetical protein K437DRAFT_183031 [Tilletiaria anomala UBC 951]|uniref:40S ribosomal protein S24 n=1 Tax=Tilletiaria anomala (strain ATCC 24038 / CBS 436.72 / UBC 951) TaxID=1037660 RepID=A0A066VKG2_TILAU|nr:uncharacterized protein K437DRAFT_183031 [Tilletiaria anomala UBC 951]KDN40778.1 hypothetical protein K437DRAFT_183031 [Tilletiaria anomala UBC 951]
MCETSHSLRIKTWSGFKSSPRQHDALVGWDVASVKKRSRILGRTVAVNTVFGSLDSNSPITLRTRKFLRNPLLQRRQCVLDVIHPARANVSRNELQEKLGTMYKTPAEQVVVFGMRTHFGGGRSTGFALIYDSKDSMKFEPKYRLIRKGQATKVDKAGRKLRKERKNRAKKVRGTKKAKAGDAKKK